MYNTTKLAIRDICGDTEAVGSGQIYYTKQWQQYRQHSRSRSRSLSRSSRDRSRSRDNKDWSRGVPRDSKSPRRYNGAHQDSRAVLFSGRRRQTPVPGMIKEKSDFILSVKYDEVFLNDKDLIRLKEFGKQYMIIDIGSPRSLMGEHEYLRLRGALSSVILSRIVEHPAGERFRFGPSKVYSAVKRVELPLRIKDIEIFAKFYIIEGNLPILIGNDIIEPLGGVIHTDERYIEFNRLGRT